LKLTRFRDRAIYDPNLSEPLASSCDADPSAILCIGDSFFDSYGTFPNTKYSHGFNLAANNASGAATLTATVPLACKALEGGLLNVWEYGNEPDLYRGKWRSSTWSSSNYVSEWESGTNTIASLLKQHCPDLANGYMAPSVSSPGSALSPPSIFADGIDSSKEVAQISVHNYITGATSPGVTLQGTLMNHTVTANSINNQVSTAKALSGYSANYVIGETNSLYGGGAGGLSNVFGAALWVLDFVNYAASTGVIKRLHFHQSVGAAYSAWTPSGTPSTNTPYYGKLAAATFLGNSSTVQVTQLSLPSGSPLESAYSASVGGTIERLAVLNMREFTSTTGGTRPSQTYTFSVPAGSTWYLQRLTAAGADVTSGVTYNGYAYNYSSLGLPSRVSGITTNQVATASSSGKLTITVQNTEAVIAVLASSLTKKNGPQ
jgi:hypothetical protein